MALKVWLQGLPTTPLRITASVFVFVATSSVVIGRLALGYDLPDNYEWYFGMILGVMGADTAHYLAKRKTEWRPSDDMVDMTTRKPLDDEKVSVTSEHEVYSAKFPKAGVKPRNTDITAPLEGYAARQRETIQSPSDEASD